MAALISRFVNVPIASARPARCPPQPQPGSLPSWLPCGRLKDCVQEERRGLSFPFSFFPTTVVPFVGNLCLTTSAPCLPLSYSLPVVHSVTVCFTLDHPLSHSLSPTSIICLSSIAVPFSFTAFLSLVNSSFSQLSPLSAQSPYLPHVLSLHLDCSSFPPSVPLSSPLIPTHSVFIVAAHCLNLDENVSLHPSPLSLCLHP